jgi:hypothetical protein
MHVFFGDDSVRLGNREGMGVLVAFGGILFPEEALRPFQATVREIRSSYKFPEGAELKWSPPRGSWIHEKLKGDDRTSCYRKVLAAAREHDGTAFVVCQDLGRRPAAQDDALRECISWCFERLSMCLEDRRVSGVLICDRPGGGKKDEDALLSRVVSTIQDGTDFVPPGQVPLNILTTPSHLVTELQVADIITGVTTAMVGGDVKYAEPVFGEIVPMFHRNARGLAGGAGFKLAPNALLNLYHWVGKEDAFVRVEAQQEWALPNPGWPYALNGFEASKAHPLLISPYPAG